LLGGAANAERAVDVKDLRAPTLKPREILGCLGYWGVGWFRAVHGRDRSGKRQERALEAESLLVARGGES
jgi:hypothetical protein